MPKKNPARTAEQQRVRYRNRKLQKEKEFAILNLAVLRHQDEILQLREQNQHLQTQLKALAILNQRLDWHCCLLVKQNTQNKLPLPPIALPFN